MKDIGKILFTVALGIVLLVIIFSFKNNKKPDNKNPSGCDPNKCDPKNKGLDMCGNFSVPCAGNSTNSTFTCDPNNIGYDTHGNFNVLCAGGTPNNNGGGCDPNKCEKDSSGKNTGLDECGNFSMVCAGSGRVGNANQGGAVGGGIAIPILSGWISTPMYKINIGNNIETTYKIWYDPKKKFDGGTISFVNNWFLNRIKLFNQANIIKGLNQVESDFKNQYANLYQLELGWRKI